jgi:hypothetical protein
MMRFTSLCLIIGLAAVLGCAGPGTEEQVAGSEAAVESAPAEVAEIVTKAVDIAKEIEADPDSAETILANHEMTIEDFDQMMYDISADPDLSDAYAAAMAE